MLNAKKLCWYMQHHRRNFEAFDVQCGFESRNGARFMHPFTFVPLNKPDTNIVCFIAVPMSWKGGPGNVSTTTRSFSPSNAT